MSKRDTENFSIFANASACLQLPKQKKRNLLCLFRNRFIYMQYLVLSNKTVKQNKSLKGN